MTLTSHGHHIPGTSTIDEIPFRSKARCGGVRLCKDCKKESSEAKSYYSQVDNDSEPDKNDSVNHPAHYTAYPNVEVIEITSRMNFCIGNAVKYLARAPFKGSEEEDFQKALWYIRYELEGLVTEENWFNTTLINIEGVEGAAKLYAHMPYFLGRTVRVLCEKATSVSEYRDLLTTAIENLEAHLEHLPYSQKD